MGSTVILLFEKGRVCLNEDLSEGTKIRMGQAIGKVLHTQDKLLP